MKADQAFEEGARGNSGNECVSCAWLRSTSWEWLIGVHFSPYYTYILLISVLLKEEIAFAYGTSLGTVDSDGNIRGALGNQAG